MNRTTVVRFKPTHRGINDLLTLVVVIMALYLMVTPFAPMLQWRFNPPDIQAAETAIQKRNVEVGIPPEPVIKIPRLGLDQSVYTGRSASELNKGIWLVPGTSTPDKKKNTVMAGHRFTYDGPAVFYFLDKVQVSDRIYVNWQSKQYTYQVKRITVVPPTAVSINDPTEKPTLTLYTCTPLLSAKNRLVIVSELTGVKS